MGLWRIASGVGTLNSNAKEFGRNIDPNLVVPSIPRPVWEPPTLEVLDLFENTKWEWFMKRVMKSVSNVALFITHFFDANQELQVQGRYVVWIKETGKEAISHEDLEREA